MRSARDEFGDVPFEELDDFDVAPPRECRGRVQEWTGDEVLDLQAMSQELYVMHIRDTR